MKTRATLTINGVFLVIVMLLVPMETGTNTLQSA